MVHEISFNFGLFVTISDYHRHYLATQILPPLPQITTSINPSRSYYRIVRGESETHDQVHDSAQVSSRPAPRVAIGSAFKTVYQTGCRSHP